MKFLKLSFTIVSLTFVFACGDGSDDFVDINNESEDNSGNTSSSSGIAFGIRADKSLADYEALVSSGDSNLPDFSSVVSFEYSLDGSDNREYVATGTLLNSEWILTAGHNFFTSDEQSEPALVSGILVHTGNDPNNPDNTYTVEKLVFHPTWINDDSLFASANDLCLVKLNTAITSVTPSVLFTTTNETIGSTVWFAGFGDYSQTSGQDKDAFSKKHAIENVLDRKVSGIASSAENGVTYTGGLLAFDFDSPEGTDNTLGDNIINEDEALLGSGSSGTSAADFEGGTVEGDSGGPLFVKDGDVWKLAGVLSGGASDPVANHKDGDYGDISIFTRVSTAIDWINSVIE